MPSPPDPNASQEAQATAIAFKTLDLLIGRYLRGEATVYEGTGAAHDNESQLVNEPVAGPYPDGDIPNGAVIAYLDVHTATRNDFNPPTDTPKGNTAVLVIHGLPPAEHVVLEQPDSLPGITEVGTLSGIATTTSLVTSCMNCAPDFAGRPATLPLGLTATGGVSVFKGYAGDGGKNVDVTARVQVSGNLKKTPPCVLTFDDLAVLDSATGPNEIELTLQSFTRSGNVMVWRTGGQFHLEGSGNCPLVQNYTIEVTVDVNDLGHWGTQTFKVTQPTCVPPPP